MAAELAELELLVQPWCDRLDGRLQRLEPYRALQQLAAREANGTPVQALASAEIRAHLEDELASSRDFRVLALLRKLLAELHDDGAVPAFAFAEPVTVAEPPEIVPAAPLTTTALLIDDVSAPVSEVLLGVAEPLATAAASAAPSAGDAAPAVAQWHTDDLHAEASAAVASMFGGVDPGPPQQEATLAAVADVGATTPLAVVVEEPVAVAPLAVAIESIAIAPAVAPEPVRDTVPVMPAPPLVPVMIAKAEATVMASLAKLRTSKEDEVVIRTAPLEPKQPSVSMEGTMANVAAAVAATVAAAGRIAEPKAAKPQPMTFAAPVAASPWRERIAPAPAQISEATEIRFVERAASPMLDVAPRSKPAPLADVPLPVASPLRKTPLNSDKSAREWEEASVEIRRIGPVPALDPEPSRTDQAAALAGRASAALGRLVKSLKGEKA